MRCIQKKSKSDIRAQPKMKKAAFYGARTQRQKIYAARRSLILRAAG